jgi:hypothetical protein
MSSRDDDADQQHRGRQKPNQKERTGRTNREKERQSEQEKK